MIVKHWTRLLWVAVGEGKPDAWEKGDVVYVHYMAKCEVIALAAAVRTGLMLPEESTG